MNVIVSATRDPSMAKTVSVLLFVKVVGRPFPRFDPAYYVETWLLREGRSVVDTDSKAACTRCKLARASQVPGMSADVS
jgi:hypothetical protein